jgi:hypothetical protein
MSSSAALEEQHARLLELKAKHAKLQRLKQLAVRGGRSPSSARTAKTQRRRPASAQSVVASLTLGKLQAHTPSTGQVHGAMQPAQPGPEPEPEPTRGDTVASTSDGARKRLLSQPKSKDPAPPTHEAEISETASKPIALPQKIQGPAPAAGVPAHSTRRDSDGSEGKSGEPAATGGSPRKGSGSRATAPGAASVANAVPLGPMARSPAKRRAGITACLRPKRGGAAGSHRSADRRCTEVAEATTEAATEAAVATPVPPASGGGATATGSAGSAGVVAVAGDGLGPRAAGEEEPSSGGSGEAPQRGRSSSRDEVIITGNARLDGIAQAAASREQSPGSSGGGGGGGGGSKVGTVRTVCLRRGQAGFGMQLGLGEGGKVVVKALRPQGVASVAGLVVGEVLLRANGVTIASTRHATEVLSVTEATLELARISACS